MVIDWLEQSKLDEVNDQPKIEHFTDKTVAWENTIHQLLVLINFYNFTFIDLFNYRIISIIILCYYRISRCRMQVPDQLSPQLTQTLR